MTGKSSKLCSRIIWRALCFISILGLSGFIISKIWLITREDDSIALKYEEFRYRSISGINATVKLLHPLNSSAISLARALSSFLNLSEMALELNRTFYMIPHISQITYTGLDGQIFSVYGNQYQTFAIYKNSAVSNSTDAKNETWFQLTLNSTNGYFWLGKDLNKGQDNLFLSAAAIEGRGVISIGLPAKRVVDHFAAVDFYGGDFYLATTDGSVIVQTKLPNTNMLVKGHFVTVQTVDPNEDIGHFSCQSDDSELRPLTMWGKRYKFSCSTVDIFGIPSVYVLTYPAEELPSIVHENSKLSHVLLVLLFVFIATSIGVFLCLIIRAARREMFLCAALVKQMDATQQAERKSMNKTTAFNRANHDVRASLYAVSALVGCCDYDARPNSELASNLSKIKVAVDDLFGILNSVLDTSKIEAGKMQLEEGEFNLAKLLEDVVDMYYHVAIKKGVDVLLDPSDDAVTKSCLVRGDRVKLKQILCNLLSNAVKFTSEGHITVRATVRKTSLENAIIASNRSVLVKCLSQLCLKNKQDYNDLNALQTTHQDLNLREFVIEVDDTGKGIPKDMQKSVFENFVQVTETGPGQEGTGLGLGIVQSLVRLMGGDIRIVDKEPGEKGTCFNFNVKLPICEPEVVVTEEEHPSNRFKHFTLLGGHAPKPNGSHVVLFIPDDERRRILTKYIESLNIKVSNAKEGNSLILCLGTIKRKLDLSYFSHSVKSQMSFAESLSKSASIDSDSKGYIEEVSGTSSKDGIDVPYKKSNSKSSPGIILIVIDSSSTISPRLDSFLANFRKEIGPRCRIVWLSNLSEETSLARLSDCIIYKPFHGSRLFQVLGLIPELKKCNLPKLTIEAKTVQEIEQPTHPNTLDELGSWGHEAESIQTPELQQIVIDEGGGKTSEELPLSGKRVLIVEDGKVIRKIVVATLAKLGAEVEECENGEEAFHKICKLLSDHTDEGPSNATLYDYIFMDCEMPIMNGYEATKLIREKEQQYGIRIPIIALTAHAMPEELSKTISAGMDFNITKPLKVEKVLEIVNSLNSYS